MAPSWASAYPEHWAGRPVLAAVLSLPGDTVLVTLGDPQGRGLTPHCLVVLMSHFPRSGPQSSRPLWGARSPQAPSLALHSTRNHGGAVLLPRADLLPGLLPPPAGESPAVQPGLRPSYIVLIVVAVFAAVTGAAALLIVRYQRMTGKYTFKTRPDNFSYQVFHD